MTPRPLTLTARRRSAHRFGAASGDRLLDSTDATRALAATRGALLGLVLGERERVTPGHPGTSWPIVAALEIAECLAGPNAVDRTHAAAVVARHARPDGRYERELPPRCGLGTGDGVASDSEQPGVCSDVLPLVLAAVPLRYVDQHARMLDRARALAGALGAGAVGVDGTIAFAAALAAAVHRADSLRAATGAAATLELRGRLRSAALLLDQRARPADLHDRLGASAWAGDAVPMAIACAGGASSFASAMHKARRAADGPNAVPALTGALAGARWTDAGIPPRLLRVLDASARRRIDRLASLLLGLSLTEDAEERR